MKTIVTLLYTSLIFIAFSQQQIPNSNFEQWENISGGLAGQEPINWNSFMTAGGDLTQFAGIQIEASSDKRPGSSGTKSAKIWSRSVIGINANGNVTLGRVNMGSTQPVHVDNYNSTIRSNPDFSQVFTAKPDSVVFWAKFTPNGHNQKARMVAVIHDDYDYRDPENGDAPNHVVGRAEVNFTKTDGVWKRLSVPFFYDGPSTDAQYILITFTTNQTPGGGAAGDVLWIDDVEMIYNPGNPSSIETQDLSEITAYPNPVKNRLFIKGITSGVNYSVNTVLGKEIVRGEINKTSNTIDVSSYNKGVYFINLTSKGANKTIRFIKD